MISESNQNHRMIMYIYIYENPTSSSESMDTPILTQFDQLQGKDSPLNVNFGAPASRMPKGRNAVNDIRRLPVSSYKGVRSQPHITSSGGFSMMPNKKYSLKTSHTPLSTYPQTINCM